MAKIAITGSTGFVGGNIAKVLQLKGHQVVGLIRREPASPLPWATELVDFDSIESIANGLAGVDAVVHCAIANDFNRLVDDREFAYDAFVGLTKRVTLAANSQGAHSILISTDWIMDGAGHLEPETNPGNSINFYGYLKGLSEQVIRDLADKGAVCRIAGVMGRHQTAAEGPRQQDVGFGYFVYSLVEALSRGDEFTVWTGPNVNQVTSPSLAAEIGAQLARVVELGATGTFHLVGDDAIGRVELAERVCEIFNLDKSLLRQGLPPESELFPAPVPVDSSLANRHTKAVLNLGPTSLDDLLRAFKRELETGELGYLTH